MYDTVHFSLPYCEGEEKFLLSSFKYQRTEKSTGEFWYNLNVENMKIYISMSYIKIEGSLAKFYSGDNVSTLDRGTTRLVIEKLSDTLKLNMDEAQIKRLDFGTNFNMKVNIDQYLRVLGEYPSLKRFLYCQDTLYYTRKKFHYLVFYDKGKECKCSQENLLRYERRFDKRQIKRLFGVIEGRQLYDMDFYNSVVSLWEQDYLRIEKRNLPALNNSAIKTASDGEKAALGYLLKKMPAQDGIDIQESIKGMMDSQNRYRFTKELENIKAKYLLESKSILVEELDGLICDRAEQEKG